LFIRSNATTNSPEGATAPPLSPVRPPEGHQWYFHALGKFNQRDHLICIGGQHNRDRRWLIDLGPVFAIVVEIGWVSFKAGVAEEVPKGFEKLCFGAFHDKFLAATRHVAMPCAYLVAKLTTFENEVDHNPYASESTATLLCYHASAF
jgi:hypothetical protein